VKIFYPVSKDKKLFFFERPSKFKWHCTTKNGIYFGIVPYIIVHKHTLILYQELDEQDYKHTLFLYQELDEQD